MSTPQHTFAYVWGHNSTGELGLGHTARVSTPSPALLPPGIVDVQGGARFSMALTGAGQIWTWGHNEFGQLGDGTVLPHRTPRQLKLPLGVKAAAIAAGSDHAMVLTTQGRVLVWGHNHRGQLGTGDLYDQRRPRELELSKVRSIAAGDGVSAAVNSTGLLYVWGRNGSSQLGLEAGHDHSDVRSPTRSTAFSGPVSAVDAGFRHLVVLTADGQLHTFGKDGSGRTLQQRLPLARVWGRVTSISAGEDHTLAVTATGHVIGWGNNQLGQLALTRPQHQMTPVLIQLPRARGRVVAARAGARHNLALTDRGEIFTWGEGRLGTVGTGPTEPGGTVFTTPRRLHAFDGAAPFKLAGGDHSNIVLVKKGRAVGLALEPASATLHPGQTVAYQVHLVDEFGSKVGSAQAELSSSGATVTGQHVTVAAPGHYTVRARTAAFSGTAHLEVTKKANR